MVILVVFNSFNVVKNLKKPDPVARQMPPFYTTEGDKKLMRMMRIIKIYKVSEVSNFSRIKNS